MIIMNENFTRCKSDELKANANISLVEKKKWISGIIPWY